MAQNPIKAESFQINPAMAGTRTISSDVDGSIRFIDSILTSGVNLSSLAGINLIDGVYTVGKSGYGAAYNSILDAVNDVPVSTGQYLIVIFPGEYTEDIVIEKDNITMVGIGDVIISPSTDSDCITIQQSVTTSPERLIFKDLTIVNSNAGKSCIRVIGASTSTIGLEGIYILNCNLAASGVGSYQVRASVLNNLFVRNGSSYGSSSNSLMRISQCSYFEMVNHRAASIQLEYDSTGDRPQTLTSEYIMSDLSLSGGLTIDLSGAGSARVVRVDSSTSGTVTLTGDRTVNIGSSIVGDIVMSGPSAYISGTTYNSVSGSGILYVDKILDTISFAASASESYTFDVEGPDVNYTVLCESGVVEPISITNKTTTGFDVSFGSPQTIDVNLLILR